MRQIFPATLTISLTLLVLSASSFARPCRDADGVDFEDPSCLVMYAEGDDNCTGAVINTYFDYCQDSDILIERVCSNAGGGGPPFCAAQQCCARDGVSPRPSCLEYCQAMGWDWGWCAETTATCGGQTRNDVGYCECFNFGIGDAGFSVSPPSAD